MHDARASDCLQSQSGTSVPSTLNFDPAWSGQPSPAGCFFFPLARNFMDVFYSLACLLGCSCLLIRHSWICLFTHNRVDCFKGFGVCLVFVVVLFCFCGANSSHSLSISFIPIAVNHWCYLSWLFNFRKCDVVDSTPTSSQHLYLFSFSLDNLTIQFFCFLSELISLSL